MAARIGSEAFEPFFTTKEAGKGTMTAGLPSAAPISPSRAS
jgi:C4-dicarboxylate-specific signal transduction histidine kinase